MKYKKLLSYPTFEALTIEIYLFCGACHLLFHIPLGNSLVPLETAPECMVNVCRVYGAPYAFRMRSVWKVYGKYMGDTWEVYEIVPRWNRHPSMLFITGTSAR
jgi:hypothetical protein